MFTILSEIDCKTSHIRFFSCYRSNFKHFKKGTKIQNCEGKKFWKNLYSTYYDQLGSSIKIQMISNSVNIY